MRYRKGPVALLLLLVGATSALAATPDTVVPPVSETGGVSGTITFYSTNARGGKPDAGAQVWLLKGRVDVPRHMLWVAGPSFFEILTRSLAPPDVLTNILEKVPMDPLETYQKRLEVEKNRLPAADLKTIREYQESAARAIIHCEVAGYALADYRGTYEIKDVPAGEYTMVMRSRHRLDTRGARLHDSTRVRDFMGYTHRQVITVLSGRESEIKYEFPLQPE